MTRALPAALAAAALLSAPPAGAADAPRRPNIVVIVSDDLGFSDLGCTGGEIATPNVDKLAAGGVLFTQFYNGTRCCPTRASLLTGLYPHQTGIGYMTWKDQGKDGYRADLNRRCVTIAEVLRPAGYRNYAVGKWHVTRHVAPDAPRHNWPLQRGFDRFYGTLMGYGSFYDPCTLTRDNTAISPFADPEYKPAAYYYTDAITDHAVRFLADHRRDHAGKPFFLYLAHTAPHWPMHAPPEDVAKYKGRYDAGYEPVRKARFEKAARLGVIDPKWGMAPTTGDWEKFPHKAWESRCMEVYAAMIDRMDRGIGRVVDELKAAGELDNTLILYLSDNGACAEEDVGRWAVKNHPDADRPAKPTMDPLKPEALLPLGWVPPQTRDGFPVRMGPRAMPGPADTYVPYGPHWANVSNTPFREHKHFVHEGGISTPLIAHWPAGIAARGELRHQPGHLIDLMATCAAAAGATYPKAFGGEPIAPAEGISLLPAFADRPLARDALYWEHEGNRSVRVGKWKLVDKHNAPWELYDIDADRTERHDLAAKHPERVKEMAAAYDRWAARCNVEPWPVSADRR